MTAYYSGGDSGDLSSTNVHFDIRLATSGNGLDFTDLGPVVHYDDPAVYQSGDELFPVATFTEDDAWYVYYQGGGEQNILSYATGAGRNSLALTGPVQQPDGSTIRVWGSLSRIRLDEGMVAIFTRSKKPSTIEIRTAKPDTPSRVSFPVETYPFAKNSVFYLDKRRKTWFMYYNDWRALFVRLAPDGAPDASPPGPPGDLAAIAQGAGEVRLTWTDAVDPDTGILEYKIYREGKLVGKTRRTGYLDTGLREKSRHSYRVSATNLHGAEGAASGATATTLPDTTAPGIVGVHSGGDPTRVKIDFDEQLDASSAGSPRNYVISGGVSVISADLQPDGRSVVLITTPHVVDGQYAVTAVSIADRAGKANVGGGTAAYSYSIAAGLIGYWRFDSDKEGLADDSSGSRNHAELLGDVQSVAGVVHSGVGFGGRGGHAKVVNAARLVETFQGSVTMSAWLKVLSVPPNSDLADELYAIISGPNLALGYRHDRRFVVMAESDDGMHEFVTKTDYEPGTWLHLAVVRDTTLGRISFYVNGLMAPGFPAEIRGKPLDIQRAWGAAHAGSSFARQHNRLLIGAFDPGLSITSWFAHADIDEVRLYDRALGGGEIAALWRSERVPVRDESRNMQ